jgi:hypothetical protein
MIKSACVAETTSCNPPQDGTYRRQVRQLPPHQEGLYPSQANVGCKASPNLHAWVYQNFSLRARGHIYPSTSASTKRASLIPQLCQLQEDLLSRNLCQQQQECLFYPCTSANIKRTCLIRNLCQQQQENLSYPAPLPTAKGPV